MEPARETAYWKATLRIVSAVLAAWFAVWCLAATVFADALDRLTIGGFPVGFWFGQQGAEIAFVVLVAVYVAVTNRLDRRFGVFED